ncbi:GntR family transcriptional regulator [Pseudomonas vanderleydeniana]|uniref:GntR family transcriptional regulator n=1 Tax=Pseudomonas vanderleydeniana TaxID=2745495 RepID=A0A9E6TT43_9PSED|nr:GntR family transcriptional regulator [Pseudomonas vanderleydeniana]QXI29337.1 GntR family transcriptional regulator [Pseudomonas vanderleydeniana]
MNSLATILPFSAPRVRQPRRALRPLPWTDGLYARVFEDILDGRFVEGLSEDLLIRTYDAGRSEVRRVVTRLTRQQIIHARPNQRAHVAEPDAEQIRQVLQARRMAEGTVIQLLCASTDASAINSLQALIARERESVEVSRQNTAIRLGGEFHLQLARIAGNAPMVHFLEGLIPLTGLALAARSVMHDQGWQIRQAILDAIQGGNALQGIEEMTRYLQQLETLTAG